MPDLPRDSFDRYLPSLREQRLTVFMPYVHPSRMLGMAESFRDRGFRLMLSDPSSTCKIHRDTPMSPEDARNRFGSNVSAYRDTEIYDDPPDVIIVGAPENEYDCFVLRDLISLKKPVAIIAMSGNFHSKFEFHRYDGMICCDLATRILARCHNVPAIRFAEANWLHDYPASQMPVEDRFFLRSFINNLEARYPLAGAFHQECSKLIENTYRGQVVIENLQWIPRDEVRRLMINTPITFHVKDHEGYGWSIIESLFIGRPIIYQDGLSKDMAFLRWIEPGISGFPIHEPADLLPIIDRFRNDPQLLAETHRRTAEIVRGRYDGPEMAEDMVHFVADLHRIARMRWVPDRKRVFTGDNGNYHPSLQPETKQDFERVWNDTRS